MQMNIDWIALVVILAGFVLFIYAKRKIKGRNSQLFFSDLQDIPKASKKIKLLYQSPEIFLFIALAFFLLAFIDFHFYIKKPSDTEKQPGTPVEGIAMYLVLDKSGSMSDQIKRGETKLDLMKNVTNEFVKSRPTDMIGLITFARQADVIAPLTLDHDAIINDIKQLEKVAEKELDGTAIGYAIYKSTDLINATRHFASNNKGSYIIKDAAIILVTDGFQDPNPLDYGNPLRTMSLEDAANYANENKVRLYIINVEPAIGTLQYSPHRRQMERVAELTGGEFFLVDENQSLETVYKNINTLEKSNWLKQQFLSYQYERISLYPYFVSAGMIALLCSSLFFTLFARRIP